jgi:hypothetical protein
MQLLPETVQTRGTSLHHSITQPHNLRKTAHTFKRTLRLPKTLEQITRAHVHAAPRGRHFSEAGA